MKSLFKLLIPLLFSISAFAQLPVTGKVKVDTAGYWLKQKSALNASSVLKNGGTVKVDTAGYYSKQKAAIDASKVVKEGGSVVVKNRVETKHLNLLDVLMLDGNYKTKSVTYTIPSGQVMGVNGFLFTTSASPRFDEYPSQQGYVISYKIQSDKQANVTLGLSTLQTSDSYDWVNRGHIEPLTLMPGVLYTTNHGNYVSPTVSINGYLKNTLTSTGSGSTLATTEAITITIIYKWIELPLNMNHIDVNNFIVGIGDSITYGYGVSRNVTIPYAPWFARFYKYLWDSGVNVKMINRGIAGITAVKV